MHGDFSRKTFSPADNFSGVYLQQGRVSVDADWNEYVDIQKETTRTLNRELLGECAAPEKNAGFTVDRNDESRVTLAVGAGELYVEGMRCQNSKKVVLDDLPTEDGTYLFYIDVWERHLTAFDIPLLRDRALGGLDTATRTKPVFKVKHRQIRKGTEEPQYNSSSSFDSSWREASFRPNGTMMATTRPVDGAAGEYKGRDNLLYRVEVHQSSESKTGLVVKWSRDNGSIVSQWLDPAGTSWIEANHIITIKDPGRDSIRGFGEGMYVELSDDQNDLTLTSGPVISITGISNNTLSYASGGDAFDPSHFRHGKAKARRWDGVLSPAKGWVHLENGIYVSFDSKGTYRVGDYWLIQARVIGKSIEWPEENGKPAARLPDGIDHRFGRLAICQLSQGKWRKYADCRDIFGSLTDRTLAYLSGDGQSAMPNAEVDSPLTVQVSDGKENSWVLFSIDNSESAGGSLVPITPPVPNRYRYSNSDDSSIIGMVVPTNVHGQASVGWKLGPAGAGTQRVNVMLIAIQDTGETVEDRPVPGSPTIVFTADISEATSVYYDSTTDDGKNIEEKTVQAGLDNLFDSKVNRSGDTITGDLHVTGNITQYPGYNKNNPPDANTEAWAQWCSLGTPRSISKPTFNDPDNKIYGLKSSWNSDSLFVGLKDNGANRKDSVIQWGDDADDKLRISFCDSGAGAAPKDILVAEASGTITIPGSVGIGTSVAPVEKLEVNGNIKATHVETGEKGFVLSIPNNNLTWGLDADNNNRDLELWRIRKPINGAELRSSLLKISADGLRMGVFKEPPNLTADKGIDVDIAGTVRAKQFVGDGSRLTGLGVWPLGANNSVYYNAGNVGIGSTDASLAKLQVQGNILQTESTGVDMTWQKWCSLGTTLMGSQPADNLLYGLKVNWDSDSIVVGMQSMAVNRKDAIIAWGDDEDDKFKISFCGTNGVQKDVLVADSKGNITFGTACLKADQSGSIELGDNSKICTPYIDFHSSFDINRLKRPTAFVTTDSDWNTLKAQAQTEIANQDFNTRLINFDFGCLRIQHDTSFQNFIGTINVPLGQAIKIPYNFPALLENKPGLYVDATYYTSDAKLKQDFKQIDNVLDRVRRLSGGTYIRSKRELTDAEMMVYPREIGVIAQELEVEFPELISQMHDEKIKCVDYAKLSVVLIEAIKELADHVAECQAVTHTSSTLRLVKSSVEAATNNPDQKSSSSNTKGLTK